MGDLQPWQLLSIAGFLLAIAELATPTFVSLPAGLAFLATAGVAVFIDDWAALLILLIINLGVVYAIFQHFVWPSLAKKTSKTTADAMAGKVALVIEAIDPATNSGNVKLYGDTWRVIASQCFSVGERVQITGTEGNKVVIRAMEKTEEN